MRSIYASLLGMSSVGDIKLYAPVRHAVSQGICVLVGFLLWSSVTPSASPSHCPGCQEHLKSIAVTRTTEANSSTSTSPKPSNSIQRNLTGGESLSHQFTLAPGEYLHWTVAPKGTNVAVTLLAPNGKALLRVNNNNLMYGPERLSWVAKHAGTYSLRVSSVDRHAIPGAYEIRVDERRPAKSEDKVHIAAELHLTVASRYHEAGKLHLALDAYQKARTLWRDANNRIGEVNVLNSIGRIYDDLRDTRKAIEHYERALSLAKYVNAQFEEAISLNNLGDAYLNLGDTSTALDYCEQALPLRRVTNDLQGEAITLHSIGTANYYLGNIQTAYDSLQQALAISRDINDRERETHILLNLGIVNTFLNEHRYALDLLHRALSLSRELHDRRSEVQVLITMGEVYRSLGESVETLSVLSQALKQSRRISDYRSQAYSLSKLGEMYAQVGQREHALKFYKEALSLRSHIGDRRVEAQILYSISFIHKSLGEHKEAISVLNQALSLSRAITAQPTEANTLFLLAQIKYEQGHFDEALKDIETALGITDSTRYKIDSQGLRASYFTSVQTYYDFYIKVLMQLHKLHPLDGFDAAALQASELARARGLYELLTEARVNTLHDVDPVLLARERSLRQLLNVKAIYQMSVLDSTPKRYETDEIANELRQLTAAYQEVQAQIREQSPRYETLIRPRPVNLKEIQAELHGSNTLLLEYSLGYEKSYLWAVTSDSINSYELPGRTTIESAAREVYALITARQHFSEDYVDRVSASDEQYWEKAAALSRMLLGPVASQLQKKRLLIVSDGALQYIPFQALPAPSAPDAEHDISPLTVDHEIVHLPSASVLIGLRRRESVLGPADKAVAVVADPVYETDDPRVRSQPGVLKGVLGQAELVAALRASNASDTINQQTSFEKKSLHISRLASSSREAKAILELSPANKSLAVVGFEANREVVTGNKLSGYRIVHFATHGVLDNKSPELSGILLSMVNEQGQQENGLLNLHDIYSLRLSADLVVLSACSTGLGKDFNGEGLVGLTRGFMYSGAQSVVASLWKVDDEATADLMKSFYKAMLEEGLKPAAALRKAQMEMWQQKRWRSPYYWAAFTLQGDWNREVVVKTRDTGRFSFVLVTTIVGAGLLGFRIIRQRTFSSPKKRLGETSKPES